MKSHKEDKQRNLENEFWCSFTGRKQGERREIVVSARYNASEAAAVLEKKDDSTSMCQGERSTRTRVITSPTGSDDNWLPNKTFPLLHVPRLKYSIPTPSCLPGQFSVAPGRVEQRNADANRYSSREATIQLKSASGSLCVVLFLSRRVQCGSALRSIFPSGDQEEPVRVATKE
ncbi:hypothetical protein VTO42DRAFT_2781 [Malbranchea cinnamomea]